MRFIPTLYSLKQYRSSLPEPGELTNFIIRALSIEKTVKVMLNYDTSSDILRGTRMWEFQSMTQGQTQTQNSKKQI
jgi:hypothetical protein